MESNDIVARLREVPNGIGGYFYRTTQQAADEIERLRKERDEARREVCEADTDTHGGALLEAERRGWNCFKENTNGR